MFGGAGTQGRDGAEQPLGAVTPRLDVLNRARMVVGTDHDGDGCSPERRECRAFDAGGRRCRHDARGRIVGSVAQQSEVVRVAFDETNGRRRVRRSCAMFLRVAAWSRPATRLDSVHHGTERLSVGTRNHDLGNLRKCQS